MLVLSRKTQETIQIGDKITITIVRVKGQTVRVGIEAPKDVRVVRGELLDGRSTSPRQPAHEAEQPARETSTHSVVSEALLSPVGAACHRGSTAGASHLATVPHMVATPHAAAAPLHFAVEALSLKSRPQTAVVEAEAKTCVDGRCRVPGASLAPLMRRPQRLGPASVGSLTGRLR